MKIAIIGATGSVGSKILAESLGRNHDVTAIGRNVAALPEAPTLRSVQVDARNVDALANAVKAHDVVISASTRARTQTGPAPGPSSTA